MTAPVFVDTNVFVYRFDTSDQARQRRAEAWIEHLWVTGLGRISSQVQHELYAILSRKLGMAREDARCIVRALQAWDPVESGFELVQHAWLLEDRHALSWWDALIVAAAQASGATALLTEDLQAGAAYGPLRVIDPFRQPPPGAGVHDVPVPEYG